ncbi:MAG: hypothetical protein INR65_12925 [Gluconacetobacter diazotrophicus]|nr:hypothetical protein [Gluconacetobacter diazotrophicus]
MTGGIVRPAHAAAAVLLAATAGCADDSPGRRTALLAMDGTYSGTLVPAGGAGTCSRDPKPLRLRLSDGKVIVLGHGHSRQLTGIVDPDGQLTAQDGRDQHLLTGTVSDGRFTGFQTETARNDHSGFGETGRSCMLQAEARRGGPPGP